MGKKQAWKKEELGLPRKQPRNCDMSSSALGADSGKEHMHITDLKKKCHPWKSRVKFMPMGRTSFADSKSLARPVWKVTRYHRTKSTEYTKILCW